MNIFHVTSHLNYSGANAELSSLAIDQARQGHKVRVCCVGPSGPWAERLEAAGVRVDALAWTRPFDAMPLWRLRDALTCPSVEAVQIWGVATLRWIGLMTPSLLSRIVLCPPFEQDKSPVDRLLLGRVSRIVVRDRVEGQRIVERGAKVGAVTVVKPGVAELAIVGQSRTTQSSRVLGVGPIEKHKNFRSAVWTIDIVAQAFPDAELSLVGTGSQSDAVREFGTSLDGVKLAMPGRCDDVAPHLSAADVIWSPGTDGCRHAVLEAMAAGKPVVASDLPHIREIIRDGVTGFLIPAGDKLALARTTRTLLLDADLRRRIGDAARRHVRDKYSLAAFVEQWRDVVRAM